MSHYSDTIRAAAILVELRGVNLGGWPYTPLVELRNVNLGGHPYDPAGMDPLDAIHEIEPTWSADEIIGYSGLAYALEHGMTTASVVKVMREMANAMDLIAAIERERTGS